jgi:hypothetical protein
MDHPPRLVALFSAIFLSSFPFSPCPLFLFFSQQGTIRRSRSFFYLKVLSRDQMVSRSVRIFVGVDGGAASPSLLRVGRPGVADPRQDLELDGVGIAAETAVVWRAVRAPAPPDGNAAAPADGNAAAVDGLTPPAAAAAAGVGSALGSDPSDGVVLCVCAGSPEAIVYVNGKKLDFDEDFDLPQLTTTPSVTNDLL